MGDSNGLNIATECLHMRSNPLLLIFMLIGCSSDPPKPEPTSLTEHESDTADAIYIIDNGVAPWGDYGDILTHGMCAKGGERGPIQLQRTGPFVPPITFPGIGNIVVTDEMKQAMEQAGFRGIKFRLVEKSHIVELAWHEWDQAADEPEFYPEGGSPEWYILNRPHSDKLADSIGTLWEVVLSEGAEVTRHSDPMTHEITFEYVEGSWNGNDLFRVSENYYQYASARARNWLELHAAKWVSSRSAIQPDR